MKKIVLLMLVFSLMLSVVACFDTEETTTTTKNSTTSSTTVTTSGTGANPDIDDLLPDFCKSVEGLNEMILFTLDNSHSYSIYYKKATDSEYTKLDDELIIDGEETTGAYILGISAGKYDVKADRKTVISSVERVSLIISDKLKSPVRCKFGDGVLSLVSVTPLGRASDECNVEGNADELEIGFNQATRNVTFKMVDGGIEFDPLNKPDPDITLSADERKIGGLGIFITKKTTNGNEIQIKYL